jgi:hypothetical protein
VAEMLLERVRCGPASWAYREPGRYAVCIGESGGDMQEIKRYQVYRVRERRRRGILARLRRWLRRR